MPGFARRAARADRALPRVVGEEIRGEEAGAVARDTATLTVEDRLARGDERLRSHLLGIQDGGR